MTLFLAAVCLLLAIAFLLPPSQRNRLRRQLAPHVARLDQARPGRAPRAGAGNALFRATERLLGRVRLWIKLGNLLRQGEVSLSTAGFLWLMVGCALVPGVLAGIAGAPTLLIIPLMAAGAYGPYLIVRTKAGRRQRAFEAQLPDALDSIAAMLKAGHDFPHALRTVAEEAAPPLSTEFGRALAQIEVGQPMEEGLAEMAGRIGSSDIEFVATSVAIQRQTGGSLADFFTMVSSTVRERQDYVRRVKTLTTVGRLSAKILTFLPFALLLWMTVTRFSYVKPLYTTGLGHVLIIVALGLVSLNALILRRLTRIEA